MYKIILQLRPYFYSLRELTNEMTIDVKIPLTWEIFYTKEEFPFVKFKEQDSNNVTKLISFIAPKNEEGYEQCLTCVKQIIHKNLEKERKEKLLDEKIKELTRLFKEKDLGTLEKLKFDNLYEESYRTGTELAGEGNDEGSVGNP